MGTTGQMLITAEMGILGLQDIVGQVQTAKLKKSLQGQISEYQTIASEAAKLLQAKGTAPKDPSLMSHPSLRMSAGNG